MPNKTIYLRNKEVETWELARSFAGDRLSPIIMRGLRDYVEQCTKQRYDISIRLFDKPWAQLTPLQQAAVSGALEKYTPPTINNP